MKIGLIGFGAIGAALFEKISKDKSLKLVFVYDAEQEKLKNLPTKLRLKKFADFAKKKADLVVEAASQEAIWQFAPEILKKSDLLVMSVGAFAKKGFLQKLVGVVKKSKKRLFVPSGAIIGMDGISAVREQLQNVKIETRKNPKGFGLNEDIERVLFDGSAAEGVPKFPKNINVAATLSLYGIGFDKTTAKVVSDPQASANMHTIEATGDFGRFFIRVENVPSKNPKTSGLAALSAFDMIKKIQKGFSLI